MEKINIVIPYKLQGKGEELKLALRSIQQNCHFDYQIILIGDCPDWINKETIVHLNPFIPRFEENTKAWNVIEKCKRVLSYIEENCPKSSSMLFTYDDIIFLNPVTEKDVEKIIALSKLPDTYDFKTDASEAWKLVLVNTMKALKRNNLPELNFETHLPRLFDVKKFREMFDLFGFQKRPYNIATLYFNWIKTRKKITVLSDVPDQKIKAGIYKAGDFEKYIDVLDQYIYLNWAENQWSPELEAKLNELFPYISIFEISL